MHRAYQKEEAQDWQGWRALLKALLEDWVAATELAFIVMTPRHQTLVCHPLSCIRSRLGYSSVYHQHLKPFVEYLCAN
jgi:predicted alpha/beta hydrolase family esterase